VLNVINASPENYDDRRVFDWASQKQFARVSGDCNPLHLDTNAARRTSIGVPIVHGMHTLLWILDTVARKNLLKSRPQLLRAQFLQPIYVGDCVALQIAEANPSVVRLRALVGPDEVLAVSLRFDRPAKVFRAVDLPAGAPRFKPVSPIDLRIEEMDSIRGSLSFEGMTAEVAALAPTAVDTLGARRISALVSFSTVVGMIVPGLHSIFSGLEVALCDEAPDDEDAVKFAVQSVDKRYRAVRIDVGAPGVRGSLETVSRMAPTKQASLDQVRALVSGDDFRNDIALVVGGSRGLGEVAAKLVCAGGGRVIVTYSVGKADAEEVVRELQAVNPGCIAVPYDVQRSAAEQLTALNVSPTHVYYFATPPIFRRKAGLFDATRFSEFNAYYVNGFFDLVSTCASLRPTGISVFYPSTTGLDARPNNMTEYCMAKAAGEVLCSDLGKFVSGVRVVMHRLPRLPTDQTSSVVQVPTPDPMEVMLPIVREMHASTSSARVGSDRKRR
jgi:hypothetical protein